jgi:hypothetical protein
MDAALSVASLSWEGRKRGEKKGAAALAGEWWERARVAGRVPGY